MIKDKSPEYETFIGSLDTTNSLTIFNYFSRQNQLTNKTPNNLNSLSNIKENYNNIWSITEIKNVEGKDPLPQFGRIGARRISTLAH